ncbi:hypothetical protein PTKIN_Ptkin02bG0157000 [Pterospermum kingtungense]
MRKGKAVTQVWKPKQRKDIAHVSEEKVSDSVVDHIDLDVDTGKKSPQGTESKFGTKSKGGCECKYAILSENVDIAAILDALESTNNMKQQKEAVKKCVDFLTSIKPKSNRGKDGSKGAS